MEKLTLSKQTPFQKMREERNKNICSEYSRLTADESQSRVEVATFLMKKYKLNAIASVYRILRKGGIK